MSCQKNVYIGTKVEIYTCNLTVRILLFMCILCDRENIISRDKKD